MGHLSVCQATCCGFPPSSRATTERRSFLGEVWPTITRGGMTPPLVFQPGLDPQQLSGTLPLSPFGLLAVQVNRRTPPCEIVIEMSVVVRVGFTPVQFGFGQPASAPVTVPGRHAGASSSCGGPFPGGRRRCSGCDVQDKDGVPERISARP